MANLDETRYLMAAIPPRYRNRGLSNSEISSFFEGIDLKKHFRPGQKVLEIGCGVGNLILDLAREHKVVPFGIDPVDSKYRQAAQSFNFVEGDATSLPYEDSYFDRVISYFVFQYIPDKLKALAEAHRVLKVGGIATIDFDTLDLDKITGELFNQNTLPNLEVLLKAFPNKGQVTRERVNILNSVWQVQSRRSERVTITKTDEAPLDLPYLVDHEVSPGQFPFAKSFY
jgi:ubiquinone/menaquinone biosynthesis C-methylase UbiE